MADAARLTGTEVTVHGRYDAIVLPIRGADEEGRPPDRAVIVLDDGTDVYLEPLDSEASVRSADERAQFAGRAVRARGTIHKVMPSAGEGLVAPCLAGVHDLEAEQ